MPESTFRQETGTIKPDGRVQGLLSQVLLEVFSYTTLELFIKGSLGWSPNTIYAPNDELPIRVNKLLDEVDGRDCWSMLLMEACDYRPSNRSLVRECALILRISEDELLHRVRAQQLFRSLEHCFPETEEGELREMLRTELKQDLDSLVGRDGAYLARLAKVVRQAEEGGWLAELARKAYLYRPYDKALESFLHNFYPDLAGERPRTGQRVSSGLDALLKIIQNRNLPVVQQILRPRIPDFEAALKMLERLNKYKGLHAQLHMLQLILPTTQFALDHGQGGRKYSRPILECVKETRRYASGLPTERNEKVWIDSLEWAAKQIEKLGQPGTNIPIQSVVARLWAALTEAPRINERIATIALDIPLAQIAAVIAEVKHALGDTDIGGDGSIEEFFCGSALLRQLQPWLHKLTDEHFEWQILDKHLQTAESMTGHTLSERIPKWETEVRPALMKLCGANPTTIWAQELIQVIDQLERPEDDRGSNGFESKLNTLQEYASSRFIDVDEELLQVSEELTKIISPLERLVELISQ